MMCQDALSLHKKFIDECYNWLEAAMIPLEGSMVSHTLLQATKVLTLMCVPQGSVLPSPSRYMLFSSSFCASVFSSIMSVFAVDSIRTVMTGGRDATVLCCTVWSVVHSCSECLVH